MNDKYDPTIATRNNFTLTVSFISVALFIISGIFFIVGLNTMTFYSPLEFGDGHFVGGDAYNYIIMATRGTAYEVISLMFALLGCTSYIGGKLGKRGQ